MQNFYSKRRGNELTKTAFTSHLSSILILGKKIWQPPLNYSTRCFHFFKRNSTEAHSCCVHTLP